MKKTAIHYNNLNYLINSICEHKNNIVLECNKSISYINGYSDRFSDETLTLIKEIEALKQQLDHNLNTINSITKDTINGSYKSIESSFSSHINSLFKE